jgi:hypothetical protein
MEVDAMKKIPVVLAFGCAVLLASVILCGCSSQEPGPTGPAGSTVYTMSFRDSLYPSAGYSGATGTGFGTANMDLSYPANNLFWTGFNGASNYRLVMNFDMSPVIPHNVKVSQAYLYMNAVEILGSNTFTAYALTKPAAMTSATWNNYDGVTDWTTPGGDFTAAKSSPVFISSTGIFVFILDTDMVEDWISNTPNNYGIIINASNETTGSNAIRFATSLNATVSLRPMITINYTLP